MFDWTGRFDGEEESYHRIFQRVKTETDYETINPNDFVLHGFAVDEGVKRNKGRVGAEEASGVPGPSPAPPPPQAGSPASTLLQPQAQPGLPSPGEM